MFLRETPTTTLAELREELSAVQRRSSDIALSDVRLDLEGDKVIALGDVATVPATLEGLKALGEWVEVPGKFLERIDPDLQQHILMTLFGRGAGVARVFWTDEGLTEVHNPNAKFIEPFQLVNVAANVIDPTALVLEHRSTKDEFRLDVIAPEGFDRGIGGDPQVGDITRGGIRIGHDRKHNLAPWVRELTYRLICTNGMEIEDKTLTLDARGQSVEEVLAELEHMAERAFSRVERTIASFYELREQPVVNPEREILRLSEEAGFPDRTTVALAERVPALGETVTMFDLVNLITNQANDPSLRNKHGARRKLECAGGKIVSEHVERCSHCRARLS